MAGFDIKSILDFNPPTYTCPHCRGLFKSVVTTSGDLGDTRYNCPVCESRFVPSTWTGAQAAYKYPAAFLQADGHMISHGSELIQHSKTLATVLKQAEGTSWREPWPTARLMFEVLSRARHFVHFTTYGISHIMIGALKMTSMRVPVYGFASSVESNARVELSEMTSEAPRLYAKVVPATTMAQDAPHQKLLIVDGLLAFKGSANLTNAGPRKADRGLDISEVVSDYEEVTRLNNKYFAPVWKRLTVGENAHEIPMDVAPF